MMNYLLWIVFGTSSSSALPLPIGNLPFEKGSILPRSTSKALASSEDPRPQQRDLIWSDKTSVCSDELFSSLAAGDPTIYSCYKADIQWDADGILFVDAITVLGLSTSLTTYLATYNGNAFCDKFDSCISILGELFTDPLNPPKVVSLPGQYTYDCSNVYCGPNAARSCDGTYSSTTCPAGVDEGSLPDIPLLRDVNCQKYLFNLQGTAFQETCRSCEKSPDSNTTTVTCDASCLGCDNNGDCSTTQLGLVFSETQVQIENCFTFKEDEVCWTINGPAEVGGYGDPILFDCQASLNENMCDCSICGYKDDAAFANIGLYTITDLRLEIDCTVVDGVTTLSGCTDASTGFFQSINAADNDCTDEQAPPVPMMPPITPSPIMNVNSQPGGMSPSVKPANTPVNQPVAPTSSLGGAGAVRNVSSGRLSALSLFVAGMCFAITAGN